MLLRRFCVKGDLKLPDGIWDDYLDKLREFEQAVKLVVSLTKKTAEATRKVYTQNKKVRRNIEIYEGKVRRSHGERLDL